MATGGITGVDGALGRSIDRRPLSGLQIAVVAICFAILFGDGFDAVAMSFAAPPLAKALSLAPGAVTMLIAATPVGAVIGALTIAPLGDRIGRKTLLVAATVLAAATSFLTATAGSSLVLVLTWRLLTGISIGVATPTAGTLAGDYAPPRLRGTLVTIMFCGLSIGSIVAGLTAAPLVARFGWPAVFVIGGMLSLAVVPFAFRLLPESLALLVRRGRTADARALADRLGIDLAAATGTVAPGERPRLASLVSGGMLPVTLLVWLLVGMVGLSYTLVSYWLPTLVTSSGIAFRIAALAGALTHVGGLIGCLIYGRLMDRIGPYRTMFGAFSLGAVAVIALGAAHRVGPLLLTSFLVGLCIEGSIIGVNAFTAGLYPTQIRSTGMGWMTGAARLGGVLGPLLAGLLLALHWRPTDIFYAVSVPMIAALGVVAMLYRLRDRTVGVSGR